MSEHGVADDELVAFVDRVLRLKEEEDAIKADVREIYAEAKARGYDKTRLGEVVTHVRKVQKDANGEAEKEAIRDLYLTAYYRAKNKPHAHAYARAGLSNTQIASISGASGSKTGDLRNTPEKEHQPSPTAGNATASDASPDDEAVADIQPETANETGGEDGHSVAESVARASNGESPVGASSVGNAGGEDVESSAGALPGAQPSSVEDGIDVKSVELTSGPDAKRAPHSEPHLSAGVQSLPDDIPAHSPLTGQGGGESPVINPRCLKHQRGEECKFSHKSYSCSGCNQAAELKRAGVPA